jgi:hypothetical protein
MSYTDEILKKQKFHEKTLSDSALYNMYLRCLDISPLFASYIWLQIPAFDLAELGLGLLFHILHIDFEPFAIDFTYIMPTPEETLQGIWAKFEPVKFEISYPELADLKKFKEINIKPEYQEDLIETEPEKGRYDITRIGKGYCDPQVQREFLRATSERLRLLRTPDISYRKDLEQTITQLDMVETTDDILYNRLMAITFAQISAFVLGLSVLGKSRLSEVENGLAKVPFISAKGEVETMKFSTLDHLQIGFILGLTPLGFGVLLPKNTIYVMPDGYKNPPFLDIIIKKVKGIRDRLTLTPWAYGNYNKPEEMRDYHKSERTNQYNLLQTQRRILEDWTARQIPQDEANPVRIRQYQSAVLQAVAWRAKRHKWGYGTWKAMTEDQFKQWWKQHWMGQGLKEETLESLYMRMEVWLRQVQEEKVSLGEKVKQTRLRLALSL